MGGGVSTAPERPEYGRPLADLQRAGIATACFGAYLGDRPLQDGPIRVLPLHGFLRELTRGRVLGALRRRRGGAGAAKPDS
jgi:hypothetical protein